MENNYRRNSDTNFRTIWRAAATDPSPENLQALGAAALRYLAPPKPVLEIYGRRWFSPTYGQTFHTVRVYLDGRRIGETLEPIYGYGNQYEQTGMAIAVANSDLEPPLSDRGGEALWMWADRIGIELKRHVEDVKRKRELYWLP